MEYRYYITTALVILVLQGLIFNFVHTITWLLNLSLRIRCLTMAVSFIAMNSLVILHVTRIYPIFRLLALILALLLFALIIRLIFLMIYHLSKNLIRPQALNFWLRVTYPLAWAGLVGFAVYNAYSPKVVHYDIQLDKPLAQPLKIGVASDFHLGKLFGGKQLDKLADIFAREQVDLILLPGDIMDDNVDVYMAENMRPHLAKLTAPLGVYATLGNHDFFGSQKRIEDEIRQAGIHVLWDQAVEIEEKFAIVGRNDDLFKQRPTAESLIGSLDKNKPIFLMDHRPTDIELHAKLPIDIQVSGHTHRGQIFPANLMTSMIYRLDYGYEKIGLGHYVVTSGYGFWGIPMRLGSQAEAVILNVTGK